MLIYAPKEKKFKRINRKWGSKALISQCGKKNEYYYLKNWKAEQDCSELRLMEVSIYQK